MILAKDWLVRIWSLWDIWKSKTEESVARETAMMCVLRFLCGPKFDLVNWSCTELKETLDVMKAHVETVMKGKIGKRLETWYSDTSLNYNATGTWRSNGAFDISNAKPAHHLYLQNTLSVLQKVLALSVSRKTLSSSALLKRVYRSNLTTSHERLQIGDILQLLLSLIHI